MRPKKFSRRTIERAILASDGTKRSVAANLKCSRQTLDNYLKADAGLATLLEEQREDVLDIAESHLLSWVVEGNERAVYFILETRGRSRGYSRRSELSGASDSGVITFNILPVTAERDP